ncbi:MAG: hypothetical protein V1694_08425 [Candidatus Eisenbacteria bacterium]
MKRKLIVLMGLDGSGKSTQAQILANWLREQSIVTEVVWMRGESYLTLPLLKIAKALLRAPKGTKRGGAVGEAAPAGGVAGAEAAGGRAGDDAVRDHYTKYVRSKRSLFKNRLVRAIWRNLVLFDFFITFKVAFAKLPKDARVVILDRYVYDSLIDIDSGFGSGGAEVRRLLRSRLIRFFPRPDKVVLIEIAPDIAMRRKDDIPSMEYLEERHGLYRMIAGEVKGTIVDGSRSIDEVRASIIDAAKGAIR